jgi:hypothetical protein
MSCYIAVVQATEDHNLDNQNVVLLGSHGERILALFSSPRLCNEAIEAFPLELDGVRAIPWECDRAELTDLVELIKIAGIEFVVFDPVLVSDRPSRRQWSTELAPMHIDTFLALLKENLPVVKEIAPENEAHIPDNRSAYSDDLPIATKSSIARLKNVLDDVRAKIEEWEI